MQADRARQTAEGSAVPTLDARDNPGSCCPPLRGPGEISSTGGIQCWCPERQRSAHPPRPSLGTDGHAAAPVDAFAHSGGTRAELSEDSREGPVYGDSCIARWTLNLFAYR